MSASDFDDFDQALQLDVLAASLRSDTAQSTDMLEQLARMLQAAVPEAVTIERGGWFMSKERPLQELNVRFDDFQYQIVRQKHGSVTASAKKLVRGVVLKTNDISVEECIEKILASLKEMSEKNAQTRRALNKFVLG